MNYDELSIEELESKRLEVQNEISELRANQALITAAYDKKARAAEVTKKLGGLSPDDVETLTGLIQAQSMSVKGIESEEVTGTPG